MIRLTWLWGFWRKFFRYAKMFCIVDVPNIYCHLCRFPRQLAFSAAYLRCSSCRYPSVKDVDPSKHTNGPISPNDADDYAEDQSEVHHFVQALRPQQCRPRPSCLPCPMVRVSSPAPSPENSSSPQPKSMSARSERRQARTNALFRC